jgi:NADPH-dependent 2,4-dienoyl-CoA reductase/sulfur reductase-like enzyme
MARTRFTGRNGSLSQAGFRSFRALGTYHKRAVIVGGGLIGIELAEMLRSQYPVSTRKKFWMFYLANQMINRHILEHHIDLRLETNLVEIISDEKDMPAVVTDKGRDY